MTIVPVSFFYFPKIFICVAISWKAYKPAFLFTELMLS